jgi:hypothetical protein
VPPETPGEDREGPDRAPPGEGYALYRHKSFARLPTAGWHGLYWARKNAAGDYELRSVPTSLGEPSAAGGVMPGTGFESLYERVDPEDVFD